MRALLTLILLQQLTSISIGIVNALDVYDCNAKGSEYRDISLLDHESCDTPGPSYDLNGQITRGLLVNENTEEIVNAVQCYATHTRIVYFCGFTSLMYGMKTVMSEEIIAFTKEQCFEAMKTGNMTVMGLQLPVVTMNQEGTHIDYIHGSVDDGGNCQGEAFSIGKRYFRKHVMEGVTHFSLRQPVGIVDRKSDSITFNNGVRGTYSEGQLQDADLGTLVWPVTKSHQCTEKEENGLQMVYTGAITLHQKLSDGPRARMEVREGDYGMVHEPTKNKFIGFAVKGEKDVCGWECFRTNIPGIVFCPKHTNLIMDNKAIIATNMETAEAKAQLMYLHLKAEMLMSRNFRELYQKVCENNLMHRRQQLRELGSSDSSKVTRELFGVGHQVFMAGNAAYLHRCQRQQATRVSFDNCTLEVPVQLVNTTSIVFADPFTWTVKDIPTIRPCSYLNPIKWSIHGQWYCSTPVVTECNSPEEVSALKTIKYRFQVDDDQMLDGTDDSMWSEDARETHRLMMRHINARGPVMHRAINDAVQEVDRAEEHGRAFDPDHPIQTGFNTESVETIRNALGNTMMDYVGKPVIFLLVGFLALILLNALGGCCYRAVYIYKRKGFGRWLPLSFCSCLFDIFMKPRQAMAGVYRFGRYDTPDPEDLSFNDAAQQAQPNNETNVNGTGGAAGEADQRNEIRILMPGPARVQVQQEERRETETLLSLTEGSRGVQAERRQPSAVMWSGSGASSASDQSVIANPRIAEDNLSELGRQLAQTVNGANRSFAGSARRERSKEITEI